MYINSYVSSYINNSQPVAQILPGSNLIFDLYTMDDLASGARSFGQNKILVVFREFNGENWEYDVVEFDVETYGETGNDKHFQSLEEVEDWDGEF